MPRCALDAGEDCTVLAKTYPTTPASAGIAFEGDEGCLSEEAFLRNSGGDLPNAKARVLHAVQEPFHKALLTGKTTHVAGKLPPACTRTVTISLSILLRLDVAGE